MAYVFVIREMLETCTSIDDVEAFLKAWDRDEGMAIYAVDGSTEQAALFECGKCTYVRREPEPGRTIVSSSRDLSIREVDHGGAPPPRACIYGSNTRERVDRLHEILTSSPMTALPGDFIGVLADPIVEDLTGTVYSNVACPGTGEIWFGHGSLPAASTGKWQKVDWPWS